MRLVERLRRKWVWTRRQRRGTVPYDSIYLKWMEFANAGMMDRGNRHLIDLAVASLPAGAPVLEIGAFCGLSTNVITYFLKKHGRSNALLVTDPWVFEGEDGPHLPESDIPFTAYRELVLEQFLRNVRFWNGDRLPHAFTLASDDFFAAWERGETREDIFGRPVRLGGRLGLCYVDGDHQYEQARRDFLNADRALASGGTILFDDSDEFGAFPEVHEVVREAMREHGYEPVAANPNHLLRKP